MTKSDQIKASCPHAVTLRDLLRITASCPHAVTMRDDIEDICVEEPDYGNIYIF